MAHDIDGSIQADRSYSFRDLMVKWGFDDERPLQSLLARMCVKGVRINRQNHYLG